MVVAAKAVANIIVPNVAHTARDNNFCEKDFAFMQCSVDKPLMDMTSDAFRGVPNLTPALNFAQSNASFLRSPE